MKQSDLFKETNVTNINDFIVDAIRDSVIKIASLLDGLPIDIKVKTLNEVRATLHNVSPFKSEPVDFVRWVSAETVKANDYNPNSVAPPEMKLLEVSILEDGYTQPIVAWMQDDCNEVIDGFHRHRVGKESQAVSARVLGYLPIVSVNEARTQLGDRMASTIRHNRARGKHRVDAMSDIVIELKRRNWSEEKIAKNLGMEPDEILRLTQITGLAELFSDQDFSKAWDIEDLADDGVAQGLVE